MKCANCGASIDQGVTACPACGTIFRNSRWHYFGLLGILSWCGLLVTEAPFDSYFCRRVMRIASVVCVILLLVTAIVLAMSEAGHAWCPAWTPKEIQNWTIFIIMLSPLAASMAFGAIKWERTKQRLQRGVDEKYRFGFPLASPNDVIPRVCIMSILFCAIPLMMMVADCRHPPSLGRFALWRPTAPPTGAN